MKSISRHNIKVPTRMDLFHLICIHWILTLNIASGVALWLMLKWCGQSHLDLAPQKYSRWPSLLSLCFVATRFRLWLLTWDHVCPSLAGRYMRHYTRPRLSPCLILSLQLPSSLDLQFVLFLLLICFFVPLSLTLPSPCHCSALIPSLLLLLLLLPSSSLQCGPGSTSAHFPEPSGCARRRLAAHSKQRDSHVGGGRRRHRCWCCSPRLPLR